MTQEEDKHLRFFRSELRSPLAAIKGYTELATMVLYDAAYKSGKLLEYVKRARRNTVRARKMIDTFVETGEINYHDPRRDKRRSKNKHDR